MKRNVILPVLGTVILAWQISQPGFQHETPDKKLGSILFCAALVVIPGIWLAVRARRKAAAEAEHEAKAFSSGRWVPVAVAPRAPRKRARVQG